ncbi:MAG: TIGR01244 family protein [Rhodobacterales bacterium 34-62-10]|nr:MAG: TIGR01244 family protein [Rhodobacterales bacterium 34-62-10]
MDIRQITPRYAVSPQIDPEDIAAIKAAGFTTLICNRPDEEVPASLRADVMAKTAAEAGLTFHALPLTHQTMTPQNVAHQRDLITNSPGPVLAYCASGTRCSVVWSLGQAGHLPVDQIMQATAAAGYDLAGLRPQLVVLDAQGGL